MALGNLRKKVSNSLLWNSLVEILTPERHLTFSFPQTVLTQETNPGDSSWGELQNTEKQAKVEWGQS